MASRSALDEALAGKVTALYALRDTCSARLATVNGHSSQGLAQAARIAKRSGVLCAATANRLQAMDHAYNLVRHLTQERCAEYIAQLDAELAQSSSPMTRSALGVQPATEDQSAVLAKWPPAR